MPEDAKPADDVSAEENKVPYRLITDIKPGEYVHRWGDWLEVKKIEEVNGTISLTVLDTNPGGGGEPREVTWDDYKKTAELISVVELPKDYPKS